MTGIYEGWTAVSSNCGTGEQPSPVPMPPREPPGCTPCPAAVETKQQQNADRMEAQWKAQSAAVAMSWDSRSSYPYPGAAPPPGPGKSLSSYSGIPEQR